MKNTLVQAMRQTRAKYERLASFHQALVEIYEEAIAKADALAQEFEKASSKSTTERNRAAIRRFRPLAPQS